MCIFGNPNKGVQAAADQQSAQVEKQTAFMEKQAADTRADAEARDARIARGKGEIDSAFSSFNDDFFNQLSDNYVKYAQPQLNDQYEDAKRDITYSLARKSNTNSSVAGDLFSRLDKQKATNETQIRSTGADYATRARQNTFADKNDVVNQLISTGDDEAARTSAFSAQKVLAIPPTFSPLTGLFTNVSALAAQKKLASDATPTSGADTIGARLFNGTGIASATPSYRVM